MSTQKARRSPKKVGYVNGLHPDEQQEPWTEKQRTIFKEVLEDLLREDKLVGPTKKGIVENMDLAVDIMIGYDKDFVAYL